MLLDTDRARLLHMIQATREILNYTSGAARQDLDSNIPLLRLVERNIEILGEAASRLSEPFKLSHPEVPWGTITGMRNRLAHVYFNLDRDILWSTVSTRIPGLHAQLVAMLNDFDSEIDCRSK